MIQLVRALQILAENRVDFVLIGGMALRIHGSGYLTQDVDICYSRERDNLGRLADALRPLDPRPRGFPSGLPFFWDASTLKNGTNFTWETTLCDIDILAEVPGIGAYPAALINSIDLEVLDFRVNVLTVEALIRAKTTAGRPKDAAGLMELMALLESTDSDE